MSVFSRYRWFWLAGAITLALAVVFLLTPRGPILTGVSDIGYFFITLTIAVAMCANASGTRGADRRFWVLMASGYILWDLNQFGWVYYEVVRRATVPDPWFMDILLFLHLIPMIAALGLRPHRAEEEKKFHVGTLDFILLLVWWLFLYAFVVFPSQYVDRNVATYDRNYGALYLVESAVLVLMLGIVARGSTGGWKRLYTHLMCASTLYAFSSQAVNLVVANGNYYTGSLYDIPLMASVGWMAAAALSARDWRMETTPARSKDRWGAVGLRLAMLAILSLPVLGIWAFLWEQEFPLTRTFRLYTVITAMLVMGVFVFIRQFFQDRALVALLESSRRTFENEQRLQSHLVQREKLASLGQLIAGAAHEIDHPLTAIMEYSEALWGQPGLSKEQDGLVRKIVHHSQRTRELIANLLSFAQQSTGTKSMVDVAMLLQRSVQMREMPRPEQKVRIETALPANLPQVWGDGHRLFRAFVQIVENGLDALEEVGGGILRIGATVQGEEVVLEFYDNGPGIKDPLRVFDPFYTTKPIGKGTGLGLSAVYGVIQEHGGQITCQNNPEGGALFVVRLPIAEAVSPKSLAQAQG